MKPVTLALGIGLCGLALAQPAINQAIVLDGIRVFPDARLKDVAWYPPQSLEIAKRDSGLLDFSLLQMRYVGRRATQDEGKFETKSVLSIQLRTVQVNAERVQKIESLYQNATRQKATLRPLPTEKFESVVNLIRIGTANTPPEEETEIGKGQVEGSGTWSPTEYWSDRTLVLFLDNSTSMVVADALRKGQHTLSLSFRFQTTGLVPAGEDWQPTEFDSWAQTIPLSVDPERAAEVIRQVDLNERTPPNYPLLSIYCFGFRDELLQDINIREVLIEASGIGGRKVTATYQFWNKQRDVTLARVKFPFAVDMKKGFRYQLRDVSMIGDEKRSPWVTVENWFAPLDVSARGTG